MKEVRFIIASLILFAGLGSADAQITVTQTKNMCVADLVKQYLIGPNVEFVCDSLHPATFNGEDTVQSDALGIFFNLDTTGCNMPMDTGLVIVTGNCMLASASGSGNDQPNPERSGNGVAPDFYATYYKYCVENGYTPNVLNDIGTLSFWIKPKIENFAFSYSFASMEYCSYVYQAYNDFFGFYFSGPYDSLGKEVLGSTQYTMQNLALVPGTNTAVMINTVNHGPCGNSAAASHPEYHIENCKKNNCKFNAYTTRLSTALVNVQADKYYRIEIDIADVYDHILNSAIYISKDMRRFDTINIDTVICDDAEYYFESTGEYLSQSGTYQSVKKNETGGDSIITVNLTVNPTYYISQCWTLKEGEYKDMNGVRIDAQGLWETHLETEEGCDSTVIFNVFWGDTTCQIDCPSGIEPTQLINVAIYPNPADNEITFEGFDHPATVIFVDNNGRVAKQITVPGSTTADISDLSSGIYHLLIQYGDNRIRKKIIVR